MFSVATSLSGAFDASGFTIAPSVSGEIRRVIRDAFTDTNAVFVPGSQNTQGNVNAGISISRNFFEVQGFNSITLSVSVGGGYSFRENFDAALTSGATAEQLGLGKVLTQVRSLSAKPIVCIGRREEKPIGKLVKY